MYIHHDMYTYSGSKINDFEVLYSTATVKLQHLLYDKLRIVRTIIGYVIHICMYIVDGFISRLKYLKKTKEEIKTVYSLFTTAIYVYGGSTVKKKRKESNNIS